MAKKDKENIDIFDDVSQKEKKSFWQRIKDFFMKIPGIRRRVYDNQDWKKEMAEYKEWKKKYRAAEIETIKAEVAKENAHRKEINAIIKSEGSYDAPGVHYEKPLKMLNVKDEIAKNLRQKPQKDISWRSFGLVTFAVFSMKKLWFGIKQFFANLTLNGFKSVKVVDSPDYKQSVGVTVPQKGTMAYDALSKEIGKNEHNIENIENEKFDVKVAFDQWSKTVGVKDSGRQEAVFDFMKIMTLEQKPLKEQDVTDLLTSVFGYQCAYNAEQSEITVVVPTEENKPCFYTILGNGGVCIPETVEHNGHIIHNEIAGGKIEYVPEAVAKISKQLNSAPILLTQISNEKGFSTNSLLQAKALAVYTDCHVYDKHIDIAEKSVTDEQIIQALNKYIVTASYLENINPMQVFEMALINPIPIMTHMEYPQQYDIIFGNATDLISKGCDTTNATTLATFALTPTEKGLSLASPEIRTELQSQIVDYMKQGIKPKDIVAIMDAYCHTDSVEQLRANKEMIDNRLQNGLSANELAKTGVATIDMPIVVAQIEKEMTEKSIHDIQSDIENKTNETVTATYISAFGQETLSSIMKQLSPELQGDFSVISGMSVAESVLETDGATMPNEKENPTIFEDQEPVK